MASPAVRHITTGSVVAVAGVAALVSYSHMQQLAAGAGEAWRSWLIPISIDGLVVAASMVLLTRRRAGVAGGPLAWGALVVGVLASLAANMADARPEVTAVLVAGWAPVAFAIAFELLLQQRRAELVTLASHAPATGVLEDFDLDTTPAQRPAQPTDGADLAVPPQPARSVLPSSPVSPVPAPVVASHAPAAPAPALVVASLADQVRPLVAQGLGRGAIAKQLGITQHQARQAMAEINEARPALHAVASGKR